MPSTAVVNTIITLPFHWIISGHVTLGDPGKIHSVNTAPVSKHSSCAIPSVKCPGLKKATMTLLPSGARRMPSGKPGNDSGPAISRWLSTLFRLASNR